MTGSIERDTGTILWLGFEGSSVPEALRARIGAGEVGAVILFARNLVRNDRGTDLHAVRALNEELHAAAPPDQPLLIAVDQEGGRVARVREPATVWPPMLALEEQSLDTLRAVGEAMGKELAALGFDIDFAPVLDVHTNPQNPIIGDRAFGARPEDAADRALAFAEGLAAAGLLSCGKHFPGHGDTDTDSHLALPRLPHDMERLRRVEIPPFARAARHGLPMIMTAHVVFDALDPAVPATLSRRAITDLLRGELGYDGVVVSDDLDMKAVADHFGVGDAAVRAIEAGCDVLLLCRDPENQRLARQALIEKARADEAFRARLAEAAGRVRRLRPPSQRPELDVVATPAHLALADRVRGSR